MAEDEIKCKNCKQVVQDVPLESQERQMLCNKCYYELGLGENKGDHDLNITMNGILSDEEIDEAVKWLEWNLKRVQSDLRNGSIFTCTFIQLSTH